MDLFVAGREQSQPIDQITPHCNHLSLIFLCIVPILTYGPEGPDVTIDMRCHFLFEMFPRLVQTSLLCVQVCEWHCLWWRRRFIIPGKEALFHYFNVG